MTLFPVRRRTLATCAMLALIFCGASALSTTESLSQTQGRKISAETSGAIRKIDDYLSDAFIKSHFPAMSVTIVDRERTLLSKSYGKCEGTDAPFLLGSVSKSFTALCVMRLAEEGKIDLDASVSEYIPNAAEGSKITVRELLNHTAGLGEHQNLTNYKITGKRGNHVYSNAGYTLLGKIIESAGGISYADFVTQNIFEPLGMTCSAATKEQSLAQGLTPGHRNWFGISVRSRPRFPQTDRDWISVSAGYITSSTEDLGKYLQMYLNGGGKIVSEAGIKAMLSEGVDVDARIPYRYCMGWNLIGAPLKESVVRHSGIVETGMAVLYILPESGLGVAMAVSTNDYFVGKDFMDRIDWSVAMLLMGEEPDVLGKNEYAVRHLLYNLIYLAAVIFSALPLLCIRCFKSRLKASVRVTERCAKTVILMVLVHIALPVLLLFFPCVALGTPLWVVRGFVPDMFAAIITSAALLFAGGVVKALMLAAELRDCRVK